MTGIRFKRDAGPGPRGAPIAAGIAALCALALSACQSDEPPRPPIARPPPDRPEAARPGEGAAAVVPLTPPFKAGRDSELVRAALLLPFSSRSAGARSEAEAMLKAAELALFTRGHSRLLLIPKDTAGTEEGARAAAEAALRDGADVILGPLLGPATRAASEVAQLSGAPVISFSNDRTAAGAGAYLLGFAPEDEIERVTAYATRNGLTQLAALVPDNAYGQRVLAALETHARLNGGAVASYEFFPAGAEADLLTLPARKLARFDEREALKKADPLAAFALPYQAVMLPEGGVRLLSLAPLLPYYDVDPRAVKFLGTSLWNDPSIAREPALAGGWFVAPDPAARERFEDDYEDAYGAPPSRLASLAFDAVALAAHLTRSAGRAGLAKAALQSPDGFLGADGLFRFRADGSTERGLAVFEVRGGRFVVIDPAPASFVGASF